ncbi:hypothetical protein E9549_20435 [Blastococcus sp. MG754426]|uniref:DUF6153 family protein n=1 Tax=unclassified Blastococcus TaxID=2619396 RepID=UPI001EF09695|nr:MULTISPECIES: DUF6153 family protein [unclassified Blastococcus]MCF6509741.1 hypothetical protein [Blastococcus sp. MG754426]MCF6514127.1 hypothetical protein [Blastococcus sp. MG754427]MCF6734428.1 hypothetical protein [Blastococcus sp. KM273129]
MAARGWTALLLLAAVFAMHGLQCTTAATEHAPGHGAAAIAAALPGPPEGGLHTGAVSPDLSAHSSDHGSVHSTAATVATAPPAGLLGAGHDGAPAAAGGHLWALCLAVLAAGLAVLLTLVLPRLLTLLPAAWARLRTHVSPGLAPLRPPDLHSLCLLRI